MKRTAVLLFVLTCIFSSGLFAASAFQKTIEKKASDFNSSRPLLVLGFDVTREDVEKYEVKSFIPDTSWQAKFKKFFTKKEYGTEQIDTYTRKVTITTRMKLFTLDKKKSCQFQEVTSTEVATNIKVNTIKIFGDNEFWEIKKGYPAAKQKISLDFIAMGVLPDWIYMHSQYMREAIETGEKLDNKTYRFINCKWIRYYVDTETLMPYVIEIDSTERKKAIVYKIMFSAETFTQGKVAIPKKSFIYKNGVLLKEYNISVLSVVDRLNEMVFDPYIQSKEINRMSTKVEKKEEVKK